MKLKIETLAETLDWLDEDSEETLEIYPDGRMIKLSFAGDRLEPTNPQHGG